MNIFHLRDRVMFREIVGEAFVEYAGFISGKTVETEPRYDVTLDMGQVVTGIRAVALRPERIRLGDELGSAA